MITVHSSAGTELHVKQGNGRCHRNFVRIRRFLFAGQCTGYEAFLAEDEISDHGQKTGELAYEVFDERVAASDRAGAGQRRWDYAQWLGMGCETRAFA